MQSLDRRISQRNNRKDQSFRIAPSRDLLSNCSCTAIVVNIGEKRCKPRHFPPQCARIRDGRLSRLPAIGVTHRWMAVIPSVHAIQFLPVAIHGSSRARHNDDRGDAIDEDALQGDGSHVQDFHDTIGLSREPRRGNADVRIFHFFDGNKKNPLSQVCIIESRPREMPCGVSPCPARRCQFLECSDS